MKKIISLMVLLALVISSLPIVMADPYCEDPDTENQSWYGTSALKQQDITTLVQVSQGTTSADAPIIKCKWEYDMDVEIIVDDCDEFPCDDCDGTWTHDACPFTTGLQVKPIVGGDVAVGYYAIVTDPNGIGDIDYVYADVYHPDGTYKYQLVLSPITDKTTALMEWDHVKACHPDLITYLTDENGHVYSDDDIRDELNESLALLYHTIGYINYCQPGGFYYVGVTADDGFNMAPYLWNKFWYIPTSAVEIDFTTVDYGSVNKFTTKWIGGDKDMSTPNKFTVRNIGNTEVQLYVWQDDMGFGMTDPNWNVWFDARMGTPGQYGVDAQYDPFEVTGNKLGKRINGVLPLCTVEKLDFSIHVVKAQGDIYGGIMKLYAYIDGAPVWATPNDFVDSPPTYVPASPPNTIYP